MCLHTSPHVTFLPVKYRLSEDVDVVSTRGGQETVMVGRVTISRHECLTIIFADVVGYTSMSDRSHPVEVMAVLHDLFCRFDDLSRSYGVWKVRLQLAPESPQGKRCSVTISVHLQAATIGDAYFAVSGESGGSSLGPSWDAVRTPPRRCRWPPCPLSEHARRAPLLRCVRWLLQQHCPSLRRQCASREADRPSVCAWEFTAA